MGKAQQPIRQIRESIPSLREILVRFWPQICKQKRLIAVSSVALFVEVGLRVAEPWPLKFVVDALIGAQRPTALVEAREPIGLAMRNAMGLPLMLGLCAGALVLVALLSAICLYLRKVGFSVAGSRILAEVRADLFSHLQRLSLSFHSRKRSGDLITRVTGDIGQVKEVAITAAMPLAANVVTLVAMMAVMLVMDWRLGLVALTVLPLFALSTRRLGRRIRQVARVQRQRKGEMAATAGEAMSAIKVVQSLSLEDVHGRHFANRNKSDLREGVKAARLSARLVGTTDIIIMAATAAILFWGALRVAGGLIELSALLVFLAYIKGAFRPIQSMAKYSGRVARAAASAERIIEILDTAPLVTNRPDAVEAPATIERIAFEGVGFGYEPGQPVLSGIDLDTTPGQVVVLAGPSGAGKSTLVNLLLRLYDPEQGRITINGRDIREYTYESLRRRISIVPQETTLFRTSVRDNIALGCDGADDAAIEAAARLARAHKFISQLPDGYDTVVGERGQTLSEGQKQRIAIARAALRDAPIIILDEPTSSLDSENTRHVRDALRVLSRDRACFIIAHDLSTVEDDNVVLYLDHGQIVERGTHSVLIARGGRYAAMHEFQAQGRRRSPAAPPAPAGATHAVGS